MWSVWRERVDVYLGTGVALVQRRQRALVSLEHPVTLPLSDVLDQVDQAGERDKAGPWSLNVFLSAALCPAIPYTLPVGVKRWSEAMAVAQATAAAAWGLPAERAHELVCTMDPGRSALAAALMAGTHQQIQVWASSHGGRLASLQPLWAIAASAPGCRSKNVRRVTVHEPGAITALTDSTQGNAVAETEPGIGMRFSPQVLPHRQQWPQGPAQWAGHWELLV